MIKTVDFFFSHQSPYCYFALDRLLQLNKHAGIEVNLNIVLPGVLRIPDTFVDRTELEINYFNDDVERTAAFLGLPFSEADPYPVEFIAGSKWIAATRQPRIDQLNYLTQAANEVDKGWAFLDRVSRLIWDGTTKNWHHSEPLKGAIENAGLDYSLLNSLAKKNKAEYDDLFASNHQNMIKAGHWGVPCYVYNGEAFYGQDRFDQLLWRLGIENL